MCNILCKQTIKRNNDIQVTGIINIEMYYIKNRYAIVLLTACSQISQSVKEIFYKNVPYDF